MFPKVIDVLDGLFGPKTLSTIYFWKPLVKSRSIIMTLVIFDFNQSWQSLALIVH